MKIFSACASIVGCVLGVGFLTGKELVVFFGEKNPLFVSLCFFVLFFCLVFLFLSLGKKYKTTNISVINKNIFGRLGIVFDFVFVATCFLSLCAMLAGAQELFKMVAETNFPFSLFVALVCCVGLCFGVKTIKSVNTIFVPVAVVLLFVAFISSCNDVVFKWELAGVAKVLQYCCFNCMLGCAMLLSCGKNLDLRQRLLSAFISSLILSFLVFILLSSAGTAGGDMPVLTVAKNNGCFVVCATVVFVGIFTSLCSCGYTVVSWLQKRLGDKHISVAGVFICAYVVSLFGFGKILSFTLPLSSLCAVVFVLFTLIKQVLKNQK